MSVPGSFPFQYLDEKIAGVSDVGVIVPSGITHTSNIISGDVIYNLLTCCTVSELLLLAICEC